MSTSWDDGNGAVQLSPQLMENIWRYWRRSGNWRDFTHVSSIADLEQVNTVSVIPEQFVRKVSRLSFPNNLYKVIGHCVSLNMPL